MGWDAEIDGWECRRGGGGEGGDAGAASDASDARGRQGTSGDVRGRRDVPKIAATPDVSRRRRMRWADESKRPVSVSLRCGCCADGIVLPLPAAIQPRSFRNPAGFAGFAGIDPLLLAQCRRRHSAVDAGLPATPLPSAFRPVGPFAQFRLFRQFLRRFLSVLHPPAWFHSSLHRCIRCIRLPSASIRLPSAFHPPSIRFHPFPSASVQSSTGIPSLIIASASLTHSGMIPALPSTPPPPPPPPILRNSTSSLRMRFRLIPSINIFV